MRRCVQCDQELPADSVHARRYCSRTCQNQAFYIRNRERLIAKGRADRANRHDQDLARHRRWRANPENQERERAQDRERNAADPQRKMARTVRWRANNPEKAKFSARKAFLKCNWNLTIERYNEILASQDGGCGICGLTGLGYSFAVDHDHGCCPGNNSCGECIRGLLCPRCNQAIGFLDDNPGRLRAAITYLEARRALA